MKRYKYVTIRAGRVPKRAAVRKPCRDAATLEPVELGELLEAGWVPVRETPMGVGSGQNKGISAYSLVLLEHADPND